MQWQVKLEIAKQYPHQCPRFFRLIPTVSYFSALIEVNLLIFMLSAIGSDHELKDIARLVEEHEQTLLEP